MKVSLCIPAYNEEKILPDTLSRVMTYMEGRFGEDYEVLFVSDGSTDATSAILAEAEAKYGGRLRPICYSPNRGKGYAVRTGLTAARGDVVIFTDCDLAYGCEVVGLFYDHMTKNADTGMLIGSRALHPEGYAGYTATRKLMSKAYVKLLAVWGGLKLTDSQSGIKAFRREVVEQVFPLCEVDRFAFDFEAILIADALGIKIDETPVTIVNHRASTVRLVHDSLEMLKAISRMKKRIRRLGLTKENKK